MSTPIDFHDFPEPAPEFRGVNQPNPRRDTADIAKLWRPANAGLSETPLATLARVAKYLADADGNAISAGDIPTTSESVLALLPGDEATEGKIGDEYIPTDPLYLTARFTTDNVDVNRNEQALAILASPSPFRAGYAVKVPAYKPATQGMRDTSIWYWKGRYYVAYTAGYYGQVAYFTVIGSDNLVDWSPVADVEVDRGVKTWGPEFYAEGDDLYILVGANDAWPADSSLYLLKALNDGLTSWGAPALVTGFSSPVNDACLRKIGGTYHMACTYPLDGNYVEFWTATNLTGPYTRRLAGNHSGWGELIEGADLVDLADGRWMITGDSLGSTGISYYAISDDDMATWSALATLDFPKSLRHGSTIRLTGNEHFRAIALAALTVNGNLNHRALESTNFDGGVPAAIPFSDPNRWAAFGYAKNVGWFFANRNENRAGDGSYGAASEDQLRSGYEPFDPLTILAGGADNSVRAAVGGVMKTIQGAVQSVTTAPTDLHSYTIPANTLYRNGDSIVWESSGRFSAGTDNNKDISHYVNGLQMSSLNGAWPAVAWTMRITLTRRSATSVLATFDLKYGNASNSLVYDMTITLSNSFVIKTQGTGVVTGDVITDMTRVTWLPSIP